MNRASGPYAILPIGSAAAAHYKSAHAPARSGCHRETDMRDTSPCLPRRRLAAVALAAASFWPLARADSGLDGRRFTGVFIQRGKTSGDADTVSFANGRLHSSACDRYGYTDGAYKTGREGDSITFEAETESRKYGKLLWKGIVRGDRLDATATMLQPGKAPIENWVVAAVLR